MTRAEQVRRFWESRIPQSGADLMMLSDAAKFINRGLSRPIITKRSLQRYAAEGKLCASGGPETDLGWYRVTREDLVAFLCNQDTLVTAADIERITAGADKGRQEKQRAPQASAVPRPQPKARQNPPVKRDKSRPVAEQQNLWEGE